MVLSYPQFLVLIPLLAVVGWFFRGLQLWKPLRVLFLLILILALCEPRIERKGRGIDLWVLADRSLSSRDLVEANLPEWRSILERSKPSRHDRIHYVDYASEVFSSGDSEGKGFTGDRSLTRTALAIEDVLARAEKDRHHRLLLFTDGYSTEPLSDVPEKLLKEGVPLDYRLVQEDAETEYQVARLDMPEKAQLGEPFLIDILITGNPEGTVPFSVFRGEQQIFKGDADVEAGTARLRFSDRLAEGGAHEYTVQIDPEGDAFPGNNRFSSWVEVVSGPRVLLVTRYPDDPVATILESQGYDVQLVTDALTLHEGMLSGAKAIILNNVAAYEIPAEFLSKLDFYVVEQGGGLLMVGGKQSFGSGGYYQSAVDKLLPVTMELKNEHRKLAVAMAIVMDRSGSMAAIVNSGNSKMDLANEGAARAVELLGNMDAVTVFAVDSTAHQIAPLLNVGSSRGELIGRIRSIESMGGGIFVYTGLKAAWEELKKSDLGQRHVILFSDAADSEEPGEYQALIAEMQKEKATISVIGLGTRGDSDAAFLEDVAKRGNGRIFFSNQPGDLPNIFAQETVTVARSTFIEDPTPTQATGGWFELANRKMDWLPQVDGYNLSYLRKGDTAALVSTDTYQAPLVAFGRRGVGRSAAVSFPLGGDFSQKSRAWKETGDFSQTLTRWLAGEGVPPGIGLRHNLTGTTLKLDLFFDQEEWSNRIAAKPPRIVLQRDSIASTVSEITWERMGPERFSAETDLKEGEVICGAIQVGGVAIPFGPLSVGTSAEWQFDPDRITELRNVSEISGGQAIVDLEQAWERPPYTAMTSIVPWLLMVLVPLFLVEALATRTGWRLPEFHKGAARDRSSTRQKKPAREKDTAAKQGPEQREEAKPEPAAPPEEDAAEQRRRRFSRAKKRM